MKKTTSSPVARLAVLAVIGVCLFVSSASAQSTKVSFTLPNEVHWGRATLPAGAYTMTFSSRQSPALVRASTGEGRALVIPVTTNVAMTDKPSGLLIAAVENGYEVRYLNLREANVSFVYRFATKSEPKIARTLDRPEVVATQLAEK